MDPKKENFYNNLAIKNLPNGGTYYDTITEYIRKKYGWPILTEEFMNDIADKIVELGNEIMSGKLFGLYNMNKYILCRQFFWINGEENVLHIEVSIHDKNEKFCDFPELGWLVVPIGLEKSLSEIRIQGIIDDNIEELTKEIDKQILKSLKTKQKFKHLYEQIRAKKNRRSTSWKNHYIERARQFYGANTKIKRTGGFSAG